MAVPSFKRRTAYFKVIDDGIRLSRELFRFISKEAIFPKKTRWLFCKEFADNVNKFLTNILTANNIRVINEETYAKRRFLQEEAISILRVINEKLLVSYRLFSFDISYIEQPAVDIDKELELLLAWAKSDNRRFGDKFGTQFERERIEQMSKFGVGEFD